MRCVHSGQMVTLVAPFSSSSLPRSVKFIRALVKFVEDPSDQEHYSNILVYYSHSQLMRKSKVHFICRSHRISYPFQRKKLSAATFYAQQTDSADSASDYDVESASAPGIADQDPLDLDELENAVRAWKRPKVLSLVNILLTVY